MPIHCKLPGPKYFVIATESVLSHQDSFILTHMEVYIIQTALLHPVALADLQGSCKVGENCIRRYTSLNCLTTWAHPGFAGKTYAI